MGAHMRAGRFGWESMFGKSWAGNMSVGSCGCGWEEGVCWSVLGWADVCGNMRIRRCVREDVGGKMVGHMLVE